MRTEKTAYNTGLAKVGVQCFADTLMLNQIWVIRSNPTHALWWKRYLGRVPKH
jgi:hypothetical protein